MFLGSDVAEHGAAVPTNVGRSDATGDVVVAGRNVGGERSESVEGGFVTPLDLFLHVLLHEVKRDVAGAFVHDLAAFFPSTLGELALHFEFGELGVVVGVGDGTGTETVADRKADVVGGTDVADVVPVGVEESFLCRGGWTTWRGWSPRGRQCRSCAWRWGRQSEEGRRRGW